MFQAAFFYHFEFSYCLLTYTTQLFWGAFVWVVGIMLIPSKVGSTLSYITTFKLTRLPALGRMHVSHWPTSKSHLQGLDQCLHSCGLFVMCPLQVFVTCMLSRHDHLLAYVTSTDALSLCLGQRHVPHCLGQRLHTTKHSLLSLAHTMNDYLKMNCKHWEILHNMPAFDFPWKTGRSDISRLASFNRHS